MHFSRASLHPEFVTTPAHRDLVRASMTAFRRRLLRPMPPSRAPAPAAALAAPLGASFVVPLSTVSMNGNFDSYIHVQFPTTGDAIQDTLLVDSGNSMMIIPNGEALVGVPGYAVLGTATEPWGCPANVVKGPLEIATSDGGLYRIDDCVFYACTGDNPTSGGRTANFGTGRISPWSSSGWNRPPRLGVTMQSPLSYGTTYPFAEFVYAPADTMFSIAVEPLVTHESQMVLSKSQPPGYTMMSIIENLEWMSVVPKSLAIGDTTTPWPGTANRPIAMVDTGGGPVFLSDPNGAIYSKTWPDAVTCPAWASSSQGCNCVSDTLVLGLAGSGDAEAYAYSIDTSQMPAVAGLTGVFCKVNAYMMGQQGMNIGGISVLFNRILVDYSGTRVGMKPTA
ncbi:MAG: hypothetical protein ACHREM_05035 [Polyangiales bacterium]